MSESFSAMPSLNNGNGAADASQTVQLNPVEIAQVALMFLARCDLKPPERQAFAHVEMLLQAIAGGQVQLASKAPQGELPLVPPQ
jgi:hypothetical protein